MKSNKSMGDHTSKVVSQKGKKPIRESIMLSPSSSNPNGNEKQPQKQDINQSSSLSSDKQSATDNNSNQPSPSASTNIHQHQSQKNKEIKDILDDGSLTYIKKRNRWRKKILEFTCDQNGAIIDEYNMKGQIKSKIEKNPDILYHAICEKRKKNSQISDRAQFQAHYRTAAHIIINSLKQPMNITLHKIDKEYAPTNSLATSWLRDLLILVKANDMNLLVCTYNEKFTINDTLFVIKYDKSNGEQIKSTVQEYKDESERLNKALRDDMKQRFDAIMASRESSAESSKCIQYKDHVVPVPSSVSSDFE